MASSCWRILLDGKGEKGTEAEGTEEKILKTYRDLLVWQKSMRMVTEVYTMTRKLPVEELYGLTSQIRRSAISIPSNIAEGYGRRSTQDYIRFLRMANGSLFEMQTQIEISLNLQYINQKTFEDVYDSSREIERMLSSLISKVEKSK